MKKTFFLYILLFSTFIFSQSDSTKVSFVAYWSLGDTYEYKVSKIKKQYKEGKLEKANILHFFK